MSSSIPQFAIVGHPNEGKSSVVSTLAEDDQVRISSTPGETIERRDYPVRVDGKEILRFTDTPGFQHPQTMLEWMNQHPSNDPAESFIASHRDQPQFAQDLELLTPLSEGSGVIYVVDGSRPVRAHDRAEMEIIRLNGNPRMAVINPKESDDSFLEDWKQACAKTFNSTRIFNAIRATYAERIALLESLKSIHQDWEPALAAAIGAFKADWQRRNRRVATVIATTVRIAQTHVEKINLYNPDDDESVRADLLSRYQRSISRIEREAQDEIRSLFKHNIFHVDLPAQSILREDLFTERTWQLLGLNKKQIVVAAAVLGAGAGVKLDLILAHLSFGLFTLSGAAIAAAAAWLKGENMARVSARKLNVGGVQISIGPNQNPQFPFVLIDRLLLYYHSVINWAHARREEPPAIEVGQEPKQGYTASWTNDQRKTWLKFIRSLSRSSAQKQGEANHACQAMLLDVLTGIAQSHTGSPTPK
jgi:hypothetical protein